MHDSHGKSNMDGHKKWNVTGDLKPHGMLKIKTAWVTQVASVRRRGSDGKALCGTLRRRSVELAKYSPCGLQDILPEVIRE